LVLDCVDPGFLRSVSRVGAPSHLVFLALVVLNLVAGFHALGTLLAVGLMMLPAIAAQFWGRTVTSLAAIAIAFGIVSGYAGLVLSYNMSTPSGPSIVLMAGVIYLVSLIFGPHGGLVPTYWPARHREA
jgi:zinc/manganese transport system permease protein